MSFSPQSRVWVYQSNREFSASEVTEIQEKLNAFTAQWQAHGHQLKAKAEIIHNFFIVITVDETASNVTGCSIDASVRVLKEIETQYNLDLFNRFNMAYMVDNKVFSLNKEDFETLVSIKKITPDTIVFNNMVQTLEEFETKWQVPFAQSWHNTVFSHLF
ncbi:hypothetical protein GCM10011387_15940 [Pedobacter quisquiliarum]|jgi:hypothetical protein|uniref:ABC transporter ATPase n=1 Tax=Pedobacter quisquiliarum TaxID=1834438 RepID=A0A916U8J8_9SPHI|nr:ABC transporter ATPase [Pedobacter quisquiliarum]GGC63146.1 hypothetical protein GCM10011387_15940 [Pedobacter quisquiliarum]